MTEIMALVPAIQISPAAIQAAEGGILLRISNYVSFTELKGLRQVCRAWNQVISTLPKMVNCTGKFGNEWQKEVSGMDYEKCLQFRSVYFRFFRFFRNSDFAPYWTAIGGNLITKVKFKFVKMPCHQMVTFLQSCPNLEEVYFSQCNFELVTYRTAAGRLDKIIKYRTCCTHSIGFAALNIGQHIPPRIHTVRFKSQDFFPLCVLDLLILRSTGVLRTFQFSDALIPNWKRLRYMPSKDAMETRMYNWILANRNRISSFSWFKVHKGHEFLSRFTAASVVLENVEEIFIGQKSSWDHTNTHAHFSNFVRFNCGPLVRSAHIRFIHRFSSTLLSDALESKPALRNLKVDGIWAINSVPLNIDQVIPRLPELRSLELWDRNRRRQRSMTNDYLFNLPELESLKFFSFYMDVGLITDYIRTERASRLKVLYIESGKHVTNEAMQLIITRLPQLEEFGLSNSQFLTDAGLTGLTDAAVKTIRNCKSGIMYQSELIKEQLKGRQISEIKNLWKLSFCMSRNVSDISIFLAFKFPHLREINLSWCLDVTDLGLHWLAKNNPALERIVLMKNRKITHFGLNRLITKFPTIKNIHTSRSCRDRKMGKQLNYIENPRFSKIVTYAKWSDKRPLEYGDD